MNYTVLVMTLTAFVLAVFRPLAAIGFVMIKATSRSDEFGLGSVTLQDEVQRFLAEFESGAPAADNWS